MEFSAGFQTPSNSEIRCQGMDILIDGWIQKGIVTHMEYVVTIETKMFLVEGSEIRAPGLQPERSVHGLRKSIAHLLMEPTGGQLYLQED